MVYWLRQPTHDQEVLSSNPGTVYWMDVAITYKPMKINDNKGSQMGHTKKKIIITGHCYQSVVNVISLAWSQSDHIKQL
jgi:hypothetical protein